MIDRYTREKLSKLWNSHAKFQKWLDVELAHCTILAEEGIIPREVLPKIREKAAFDVAEIEELEKIVKHDVIAFITHVSQRIGPEGRYLHYGLTSSDVLDTSFALLLKDALSIILDGVSELLTILKEKAFQYKHLSTIGRSHGIHAEPTSFGLKFALWYEEMKRNEERLNRAKEVIGYGKFSGAVGNFSHLAPQIEEKICEKLGLKPDPISTQIIQRDRHAEVFSTLAIVAGTIEKIAVEIRHLQRTEVLEVEEPFSAGQKGSSAMPHKKNPIMSENLTGLARLVRSYAQAAFENMALWHERDISHSSVERVIAPDATSLVDFMIHRLAEVIKGLIVYEDHITENLNKTQGLIYSQKVLLALTKKNVERQKAYEWVQKHALEAWNQKVSFRDLLQKDPNVKEILSTKELEDCFNPEAYLKHVDDIYGRVFHA